MVKTDVSTLYKTKLCKKYSLNGVCPYGVRCQFIHDISDANPLIKEQIAKGLKGKVSKKAIKNALNEVAKQLSPKNKDKDSEPVDLKLKSAVLNP